MDGKLKGHAALWVANIIWGLNAPIGKSVLWSETHPQGVSPFALSVYRMLGACLLFWTVSLFLPREKVAPRDIVLLLILVSRHGTGGTSSVAGDVLCVISAVSYATYLTAFRNVIVKYSPVTTMKWMFLFAAVAAVAIYYRPLAEVDYAALAPRTWAGIGYVVVCSTFLSYFMVPVGQRYLRPTVVSMYNYVQPLVAVLFTVAVGLDTFGFTKGVAALCVFAGVWLVTKSKSRAQLDAERAAAEQAPENRPRA